MGQVRTSRRGGLHAAALLCAALFCAALAASVRLGGNAAPVAQPGAVETSVATLSASKRAPATRKHCPRAGANHAIPACASTFQAVYHAVEDRTFAPPLTACRPCLPGDETARAQCNGLAPCDHLGPSPESGA